MFLSFATEPLTRERPTRTDDGHGGFEDDWTSPQTLALFGSVQPGASADDMQNRDGTLIQWTVYVQGRPDVLSSDRIIYEGQPYAIDGQPARWKSPTGALDNTTILLKRWEG